MYGTDRELARRAAATLTRLRADAANGEQLVVGGDRDLDDVVAHIRAAAARSVRPPSLALHAAAVELHGRVILLPAPAGGGKSSLAVALAQTGWAYLGDEVVAVRQDTLAVRACPTPPRNTSDVAVALGDPTAPRGADGKALASLETEGEGTRAPDGGVAATQVGVPRYAQGAATLVRPLSPPQAVDVLARCVFPSSWASLRTSWTSSRNWQPRLPAYSLEFGDVRSAATAIAALCPSGSAGRRDDT